MFDFIFKKQPKQQILIFCGAGVSQESGLDTFRDKGGLWHNYDLDEVCNIRTFHKNRDKVFDFYNDRKNDILKAKPNIAHYTIAQIQRQYGEEYLQLFTSNIDNLLEKAGCKNVHHIHGDILGMECLDCNCKWDIGIQAYDVHSICPSCESPDTKPNIVFFNEAAPKYTLLKQHFESSGNIVKGKIVPHIKLIIGTSFKVIKMDTFSPSRSRSILVDKNEIKTDGFEKVIQLPATEGIVEGYQLIQSWYEK